MTMIEKAGVALRESLKKRPYGGYDYGHNEAFYGPAPKEGRYVVRCERTNKIVHQTNDHDSHQAAYERLTNEFHARAALQSLREPSEGMVDRFVSRALCVSVDGEGGWSEYARNQWQTMIDGALEEG